MKDYYLAYGMSKQAHFQALERAVELDNKVAAYVGFIEEIRVNHPGMGLRAMYEQFSPSAIGRDAFISLGLQQGFRLRKPHNPMITTRSVKSNRFCNLLRDVRVTGVNQVWVTDLFYYPCGDQHFYGVQIMDVYSRRVIGYSMSDNMRAEQTLAALNMALTLRGIEDYEGSLIHHSDRGSQYVSNIYTDALESRGVRISMCATVLENAHSERVNGTLKNQYLSGFDTGTPRKLIKSMDKSVVNYNNRNHSSLNKKTPIEYETYLQGVPMQEREVMIIFTDSRTDYNLIQSQLSLFEGVTIQ